MSSRLGAGVDRGFVLVTVLWMSLALALGVASYMAQQRSIAAQHGAQAAVLEAGLLAESAWVIALADLLQNPETIRNGSLVTISKSAWPRRGVMRYRIFDERGRADLNKGPVELLTPLFVATLGDPFRAANIVSAIESWRERPDLPRLVMADLRRFGLSTDEIGRLSQYVTTFNFSEFINPLSASETMLRAVPGIGIADIRMIALARQNGQPLPSLGSAGAWFGVASGRVLRVEAEGITAGGVRGWRSARILRLASGFRRGAGEILRIEPFDIGIGW